MSKSTKLANTRAKNSRGSWPFVIYVGAFGFGLLGYLFSQMFTAAEAHPSHWLVALVGAVLGGILGGLWYRWRGDII